MSTSTGARKKLQKPKERHMGATRLRRKVDPTTETKSNLPRPGLIQDWENYHISTCHDSQTIMADDNQRSTRRQGDEDETYNDETSAQDSPSHQVYQAAIRTMVSATFEAFSERDARAREIGLQKYRAREMRLREELRDARREADDLREERDALRHQFQLRDGQYSGQGRGRGRGRGRGVSYFQTSIGRQNPPPHPPALNILPPRPLLRPVTREGAHDGRVNSAGSREPWHFTQPFTDPEGERRNRPAPPPALDRSGVRGVPMIPPPSLGLEAPLPPPPPTIRRRRPTPTVLDIQDEPDTSEQSLVDTEDDMACGICRDIIQKPTTVPCCRKTYCHSCINSWLRSFSSNRDCPNCRRPFGTWHPIPNVPKAEDSPEAEAVETHRQGVGRRSRVLPSITPAYNPPARNASPVVPEPTTLPGSVEDEYHRNAVRRYAAAESDNGGALFMRTMRRPAVPSSEVDEEEEPARNTTQDDVD